MKIPIVSTLVSSLTVAILALTPASADARSIATRGPSPGGANDPSGGGGGPGAPAALVVSLSAQTQLSPPATVLPAPSSGSVPSTGRRPIDVGPGGGASLQATNTDGQKVTGIYVSTRGLADGTYAVAVTKKSDGSAVTLGTLTVAGVPIPPVGGPSGSGGGTIIPIGIPGPGAGNGGGDPSTSGGTTITVGPAGVSTPGGSTGASTVRSRITSRGPASPDGSGGGPNGGGNGSSGSAVFGTNFGTPLPAGFDGFDVGTISVSDSAGVVVLTGDLTKTTDLVKRVALVAGASVPAASGLASVSSATRGGVTKSGFTVTGKGLPANAELQLVLNGADVQAVKAGRHGHVRVRRLPAMVDIAAIMTVALHDAAGVILLSGSF